jgi:hypothetical protein
MASRTSPNLSAEADTPSARGSVTVTEKSKPEISAGLPIATDGIPETDPQPLPTGQEQPFSASEHHSAAGAKSERLPTNGTSEAASGDESGQGSEVRKRQSQSLEDVRTQFARTVTYSYWVLIILIPALVVFMLALLGGLFGNTTIDRLALVTSLQVGLGMFLGFMSLYFGVMMTWMGIEAAFNLSAGRNTPGMESKVTLTSASPGLFFGLLGAVLIVMCLYKTIEFTQTGFSKIDEARKESPKKVVSEEGLYTPASTAKGEKPESKTTNK